MARLLIRDTYSGVAWQVWPEEAIPSAAVRETGQYAFELVEAAGAASADLLIDDIPLQALRSRTPTTASWRWETGFHAGTVDVELRLPAERPKRFRITTDPDLRKLTTEQFDTMLREILEDTFALFSLSPFRRSIARGAGSRPPAIARLEFLRSRIGELERITELIAQRPRRRLTSEEGTLPWHRALRATGPEILRSMRSGRVLTETRATPRLPAALQRRLPERITSKVRRNSLDLIEHRQMKACLGVWASWLEAIAGMLDRPGLGDEETTAHARAWALRCRGMERRLRALLKLEPLLEAGEAKPRLLLSSVFRHDPAYRAFFRLGQDMNLGIAAVFGDFLDMPLARTYHLYERWCFLRLVRAAVAEFGDEGLTTEGLFATEAAGGLTVGSGAVTVGVGPGWKLCFQRQFREFWVETGREGSYSRVMKPDICIRPPEGHAAEPPNIIVLDAKYRIGTNLNDALSSIHTYRDALVRGGEDDTIQGVVRAAYLLSPYDPNLRPTFEATDLTSRLFHPAYRERFRFGAVTLKPGMSAEALRQALRLILADAIPA